MNYNELKKRIEADGWKLERSGKGSHRIFKHPVKKGVLSIPDHGAKDLG